MPQNLFSSYISQKYKNTVRIARICAEKLTFTLCFTDTPEQGGKKTDAYGQTTILYRGGEKAVFLQI